MGNILTELFLYEYFLLEAVIKDRADKKDILNRLKASYFITDEDIEDITKIISNEQISVIKTEAEYKRFRRIIQYLNIIGENVNISDVEMKAISIKGEALKSLSKHNLKIKDEMSKESIEKMLINSAMGGDILSLRILGFLEFEGIVVNKNKKLSKENLYKGLRWGNLQSTLLYLNYFNKEKNIDSILYSIVKNTLYESILDLIRDKYGIEFKSESKEINLLRSAISLHKLDEERYESLIDRILYSNALSINDKERILLSEDRSLLDSCYDLPLNLSRDSIEINENLFKDSLFRSDEQKNIKDLLIDSSNRMNTDYKPICITTDSSLLLDYYSNKVSSAIMNANVQMFDISELCEYELGPTKNNLLLRHIEENRINVFIFKFIGDIQDDVFNDIKAFLKTNKRRKYIINSPAIELDISSIIPVCICDSDNYKRIKELVNSYELEAITTKDKEAILKENIVNKYQANISDDVLSKLALIPMDKAEKAVSAILKEGSEIDINKVDKYLADNNITANNVRRFGFGGVINENK